MGRELFLFLVDVLSLRILHTSACESQPRAPVSYDKGRNTLSSIEVQRLTEMPATRACDCVVWPVGYGWEGTEARLESNIRMQMETLAECSA